MTPVRLLLALVAAVACVDAYKILVIFPMPGKSHGILGDGVVRHLLNAGHEVTYITSFLAKNNKNPKLTEIDVSSNMDLMAEEMMNVTAIMENKVDLSDIPFFMYMMREMSKSTMDNKNVQNLLKDTSVHFDLIIGEWMFNELYSGIAGVYQAPFVYYSSVEPHFMILNLVDGILNPAYTAFFNTGIPPFTFSKRIKELWNIFKNIAIRETIMAYLQNSDYQRLIAPHIEKRGRTAPSFETLKYNASLVLGNSHVSLGIATTIPQIYKPIAGYHIDDTPKPLTEELKKIMDGAKHGVIYFSLGSNIRSKYLSDGLKKDLLELFGSLKQTVLWKFEADLQNIPSNVHLLQWAPQLSILSHPNCILFITHGGLLSTTEAIHTATPIVGIPIFADQFMNVQQAVSKGFASEVTLSFHMVPQLKEAVNEMISNPKYLDKVKELSFIYHDRPVKPGDELVHWVEHVIKTNGAPHLRSPALHVPWYQKMYLDVTVLLILVLYVVVKLFNLVRKKKNVKLDKTRKNQ